MGKEGRKRERDIVDWGKRERTEVRRENGVGGKRGQHWLILTDGLNQHMGIFGFANSLINTQIFLYTANSLDILG